MAKKAVKLIVVKPKATKPVVAKKVVIKTAGKNEGVCDECKAIVKRSVLRAIGAGINICKKCYSKKR